MAATNRDFKRSLEVGIGKYFGSLDPKVLGENTKLRVTRIRLVGSGTRHFNYMAEINGKKYNVRLSLRPHPGEHVQYEYMGLKAVEGLGVAPKAYYHERSGSGIGLPFLVLEYIDGRHPRRFDTATLKELARVLAALHSVDVRGTKRTGLKYKATKAQILKVIREKVDHISGRMDDYGIGGRFRHAIVDGYRRLEAMEVGRGATQVIGHGDIVQSNIIITKKGLRLIDWETISVTDPAYDIASFFDRTHLRESGRKIFLDEYLRLKPDKSLRRRLVGFMKLRVFDRMCWCIWEAFDLMENERHVLEPRWRTPGLYLKYGRERFEWCKKAGIIPAYAEWDFLRIGKRP